MQARYWGESGWVVSEDERFVIVLFPDGDRYRFPKGTIGLELPHTDNRRGRPRRHADNAGRQRAYRRRKRYENTDAVS